MTACFYLCYTNVIYSLAVQKSALCLCFKWNELFSREWWSYSCDVFTDVGFPQCPFLRVKGHSWQVCFLFCVCVLTAEAQGLPCEFSGQVYQHGEDFQPNCQHQCTCMDGVVGCMPLCPHKVPLPNWRCSWPRLARPEGGCCEEWVCDDDNHISEEPDEPTHTSLPENLPLPNHISDLAQPPPRPPAVSRGAMFKGNHCISCCSGLTLDVAWIKINTAFSTGRFSCMIKQIPLRAAPQSTSERFKWCVCVLSHWLIQYIQVLAIAFKTRTLKVSFSVNVVVYEWCD